MPVLKYFSADWCGPCSQQKPIVNSIEDERDDVTVERHDVDEEQALANEFNVRTVPTIIVMDGDAVHASFNGVTQEPDIVDALESAQ